MIEMRDYLMSKGFSTHPFNTFDADREKNLKRFVVLPPYFESVFGIPEDPQPFLVLGMRGLGKTTLKCMIQDRIREQYHGRVASIDYSQFPFIQHKELSEVTLLDHLMELMRLLSKECCDQALKNLDKMRSLKSETKEALFHLAELYLSEGQRQLYYPKFLSFTEKIFQSYPRKKGRDFFLTDQTPVDEVVKKGDYSLVKVMEIFKELGFMACYIFIDKLDETTRTMKEPESAGLLAGPLISCLEILQRDFFSFQFFVPAESIPNLKRSGFRNDKVQNQVITWNEEKLAEVLRKRIIAFNKDGKLFGKLGNLCEAEIEEKIDEFIVKKSLSSPRNLLRFCNAIFSEHMESAKSVDDPITRKTVAIALKKYEYSLKIDQFCADDE